VVVPWIRQLVTTLLLQIPENNARPVYLRFVVDKVALGQVFF